MALIKSALELALERTADIKGDKSSIESKQEHDAGRRLSSRFLDREITLEEYSKEIKNRDKNKRTWFMEGCFKTLTANLVLPMDDGYANKLDTIRDAMLVLIGEKKHITSMFEQIKQFFAQYLTTRQQIEEQLTSQYEPHLRRKEQELSRQMGYAVSLSPMQDPEFLKALQQHSGQLEKQYNEALHQAREQMKQML